MCPCFCCHVFSPALSELLNYFVCVIITSITISEIETYTINQLQHYNLDELRTLAMAKASAIEDSQLKDYFLGFISQVAVSVAADAAKELLINLISFLNSFN